MNIQAFSGLAKALFDTDVGYWVVRNTESIVQESFWTIGRVIEFFSKVESRFPGFLHNNFTQIDDIVNPQLIAEALDSAFRLMGDETKEVFVYRPDSDKV